MIKPTLVSSELTEIWDFEIDVTITAQKFFVNYANFFVGKTYKGIRKNENGDLVLTFSQTVEFYR